MTKIEWTDKTWNPVSGCTKCSPGCENCYAEKMARRLAGRCGYPSDDPFRPGTLHPDKLDAPLQWKKPCKIFVCSMGDLFHEDVALGDMEDVMYTIRRTPQHTYLFLTKRPEPMRDFFEVYPVPDNLWLGVTVCNQEEADEKIPVLLDIPAVVRFVSIEPMLGEIDLWGVKGAVTRWSERKYGLDWVICGGETGANARPMNPDWARALRKQCKETDTPFFFKQMSNREPIPQDLMVREFPKQKKGEHYE